MKSITVCLTGAIALVSLAGGAAAPLAGEATVYKQPNFSGAQLTLRGDTPNLAPQGFHDQASSLVLAGTWELCSQPNYRGDCMTLGPGRYATLDPKLNHRIESARQVAARAADTRQQTALAQREDRHEAREPRRGERGAIDLYPGAEFRGRPLRLEQDTESLDGSRMQGSTSSIVVHDGTWQLCSRPAFEGRCRTFEPGRYATLAGMDDRVASAKLLR